MNEWGFFLAIRCRYWVVPKLRRSVSQKYSDQKVRSLRRKFRCYLPPTVAHPGLMVLRCVGGGYPHFHSRVSVLLLERVAAVPHSKDGLRLPFR